MLLQQFIRTLREARAHPTLQHHMGEILRATELTDEVGEPIGVHGHVGIVDLGVVTQDDDLGAVTCARDERAHLMRRVILTLVDDEEASVHRATTRVHDRFDGHVFVHDILTLAILHAGDRVEEHVEVVVDSAHPRVELLLLGAWEETDVLLPDGVEPADEHEIVITRLATTTRNRLLETSSERKERLPRTRRARENHEIDVGIHERPEREALLFIALVDVERLVAVAIRPDGLHAHTDFIVARPHEAPLEGAIGRNEHRAREQLLLRIEREEVVIDTFVILGVDDVLEQISRRKSLDARVEDVRI